MTSTVDDLLRKLNLLPLAEILPLPKPPNIPPPLGLGDTGQKAFRDYLAAGPYKAFAMDQTRHYGWVSGQRSQDLADTAALSRCQKVDPSAKCVVVSRTASAK